MLTNLYLENFKSFGIGKDIHFAPLTILCGSNSSGKSSILQSILTLKQSSETVKTEQGLLLNGRFAQMGSFIDVVNNHDTSKELTLGFKYNLLNPSSQNVSLIMLLEYLFDFEIKSEMGKWYYFVNIKYGVTKGRKAKKDAIQFPINVRNLTFDISCKSEKESAEKVLFKVTCKKMVSDNYKFHVSSPDGQYLLADRFKKSINTKGTAFIRKAIFLNFIPKISPAKSRSSSSKVEKQSDRSKLIDAMISPLSFHMREIIKDVLLTYRYIGPLREKPARKYIFDNEIKEIGTKGENAAYIFQEEENKKISNFYLYDYEKDAFLFFKEPTNLSTLTRRVLNGMRIGNISPRTSDNVTGIYMNASRFNNTTVSIADVGFGVSQIFPIVLEGLRMEAGDTLLLEQPEIHLHPNLQMQMADFFIGCMLSGKRLIIETHSDHLINRVVRRIVEDGTFGLGEYIKVYFIKPGVNEPDFEQININPERGITNWPKDFFDQSATEQEKIIQAGIAKRRKRKNNHISADQ